MGTARERERKGRDARVRWSPGRGCGRATGAGEARPADAVALRPVVPRILAALLLCSVVGTPASAQVAYPSLPGGIPVVVLPLQAVRPTADGAWPGGEVSSAETREALDAELQFALSEFPRASAWLGPREIVRRAGRNPTLGVDPRQLAHRGLLAPKLPKRLSEPFHGQLRTLTAITDSRYAVLPLELRYEPADSSAGEGAEAAGHAVLRVAVLDSRTSRVLWRGEIRGAGAPPRTPGLLADLAARTLAAFLPS